VTESGQLDYTRADAYDEELVRANTNKVKLAVKVAQPTPVKVVVVPHNMHQNFKMNPKTTQIMPVEQGFRRFQANSESEKKLASSLEQ